MSKVPIAIVTALPAANSNRNPLMLEMAAIFVIKACYYGEFRGNLQKWRNPLAKIPMKLPGCKAPAGRNVYSIEAHLLKPQRGEMCIAHQIMRYIAHTGRKTAPHIPRYTHFALTRLEKGNTTLLYTFLPHKDENCLASHIHNVSNSKCCLSVSASRW